MTAPEAAGPPRIAGTPDEADDAAAATDAGEERATLLLSGVMVVAAIVVLVDAAGLRGGSAPVGPAAAPTLVGVLLGTLGIALAVQSRGALRTMAAFTERPARWGRLAALIAALIAFAVLLPFAGWTLCATGLFTAAALLLGAPNPVRTAAYGFALAGTVFLIFDGLIGLILPAGPWGF
ncbi:tripartite tricarboxylate transporter TctB family protein [Catenuloplanes sp. NPDC051500]|uniref:tripartite tricarboxylate transporter TctB family protein n=1 Tax=Catenuloplanes sp. NPDC051500 TaxID=3363959 RepID=UPI0037B2234F